MTEAVVAGPLALDEAEAVAELAALIWHAHYPSIITVEQIDYMLAERYKPALIRQTLARGDRWLAARAAGVLVGFAHGYALMDGDYKLDKLYVHPDWQRHGIGRLLMDAMTEHARRHGSRRLVLRVNRNNAQAVAAYRKYGFEVLVPIVEDIGEGFVMDDYVMTKDLEPT
ncbi:MAG: GNAT family N-acetyltransferase [Hydrogenophilaceae bacterium]|nr:GNAT family N-acetyltransferase [Hydrogenophilaceae bacterium]